LFSLQPAIIVYKNKMWEILTMWRVSGRWSPKCGSLPPDAGDLVGLVGNMRV